MPDTASTIRQARANDYEVKANECLALSDQYQGGYMQGAQMYATQAVAYALLAQQARMAE